MVWRNNGANKRRKVCDPAVQTGAIILWIAIKTRKLKRKGLQVEQEREANQETQEKRLTDPTSEAADK